MAPNAYDPRQVRLGVERQRLEQLNQESDCVHVEPIDLLPGSEPERYLAVFRCRGIVGINAAQEPVYGTEHKVEIYCDEVFPAEPPRLRWLTSIWHPNVQHEEPKGVCINRPAWLAGMRLDDLCRLLFEMAQYKNYHADFTSPWPLDAAAARWVREYAEPRGIVDKKRNISVDNKPFTRPTVGGNLAAASRAKPLERKPRPAAPRIRLVPGTAGKAKAATGGNSRVRVLPRAAATPRPAQDGAKRVKIIPR
jgi:ubiquitin-protein ligase